MKCPLRNMADRGLEGQWVIRAADCLKEECAWWNELAGRCAVAHLAANLAIITSELHWLAEKMPQ